MRKVVTGEQVARIYNPDPFARPIWRAPAYQTPAGIILAAWLVKLIARLLRLIFRHPAAAVVLAVLGFLWASLGWIGPAALVAWAVVVLGIWRCSWPVAFGRLLAQAAAAYAAELDNLAARNRAPVSGPDAAGQAA